MGYYLMVKELEEIGIKYLCKCKDNRDYITYRGSGIYWRRLIKKYNFNIKTTILGHYHTNEELRKAGEYYSKLFNIVEDKSWANLIPEIGDGGSTIKNQIRCYNTNNTKEQKVVSSEKEIPTGWVRGTPGYKRTKDSIEKTSSFHQGRKRSEETKLKMKNAKRKKRATFQCEKCRNDFTSQNLTRHKLKCLGVNNAVSDN